MKRFTFSLFVGLILSISTLSQFAAENDNDKFIKSGFIDVNYYPILDDVKSDSTLTVNVGAQLPYNISYFSLTNWSDAEGEDHGRRFDTYYSEQNLYYSHEKDSPIGPQVQWNLRSGDDNDRYRVGVRWYLNKTKGIDSFFKKLNMMYFINFHLKQWDHQSEDIYQLEHVWRCKIFPEIFDDRVYMAGFADQTFGGTGGTQYVAENQFGIRLVDTLHLITEHRYNTFRKSDENNIAVGLQYLFKF